MTTPSTTSFAGLIQFLTNHSARQWLLPLQNNGILSVQALGNTPISTLAVITQSNDEASRILAAISQPTSLTYDIVPVAPSLRSDRPVNIPSKRGRFEAARTAAREEHSSSALSSLHRDVLAPSTIGPQQSRWNTWCKLATAWKLPPLPLTVELIEKIAASLKQGQYRSSALYFSLARVKHRRIHGAICASIEQAITDSVRSICRGMGPAGLKDSFVIEQLRSFVAQTATGFVQSICAASRWWSPTSGFSVSDPMTDRCHVCDTQPGAIPLVQVLWMSTVPIMRANQTWVSPVFVGNNT